MERTLIDSIDQSYVGKEVKVSGWIVTKRDQKKIIFIKLADSWQSRISPLQIVFQIAPDESAKYEQLRGASAGFAVSVTGIVIESPAPEQPYELQAKSYDIVGKVQNPALYPMSKTDLSLEHYRSFPQLECFASTKACIYGLRSLLMKATEEFFDKQHFTKVDMPLLTFSECEGGCQPMQATLLLEQESLESVPIKKDTTKIDFTKDFFGRKAYLTVSSQLELETQLPLGNVWTVTRAVRGEPSLTTRHLGEFTMIELEMQFISGAVDVMNLSERYIKYCLEYVMKHGQKALQFLEKKFDKQLITNLSAYATEPFVRISHEDAVTLLLKEEKEGRATFGQLPAYDDDMGSDHERYLTDVIFKKPVIVTHYPQKVKAFYMPVVDPDEEIKHVDSFDILVPDVGELVGGSARISDVSELEKRVDELSLSKESLDFYFDLRRNGSIPHGGMGLGFERLVKFVSGADSVRDCVPFPRYFRSGKST